MTIRIVFVDGTEDAYPDGMYPVVDGAVLRIKSGPYLTSPDVSCYPLVHVKRWDER